VYDGNINYTQNVDWITSTEELALDFDDGHITFRDPTVNGTGLGKRNRVNALA
jgi:hypothetical protein